MDGSSWTFYPAPAPRQAEPRGGLIGVLRRWRRRARERKLLAALDDRMLADIGITGTDRARECEKPFWRA
ncbi:MAG: DUF1127 domain-containing protein [Stellaceae bacterium]